MKMTKNAELMGTDSAFTTSNTQTHNAKLKNENLREHGRDTSIYRTASYSCTLANNTKLCFSKRSTFQNSHARRSSSCSNSSSLFAGCDGHQLGEFTRIEIRTVFLRSAVCYDACVTYLGFTGVKICLNKDFAKRYVFANITQRRLHGLARSKYTNSTYLS